MKFIYLLFILAGTLFSSEYYAKLEPIQTYIVKSSVNGKVVFSNDKVEGFNANDSLIIEIDNYIEKIELKQTEKKITLVSKMLKIEKQNYERLLKVKTRSSFEKDAQLLKSLSLESTNADLLVRKATLEDIIKKKKLVEKNRYIYKIHVKKDDFVNPGTLLYEAKDLSKGKLEIFVPIKEVENLKNKTIYLDNEKTNLKIDRIYTVADSRHISSYKVDIIVNNPNIFSRLVKIEFK